MVKISKDMIKGYALENAIKYDGKANQGAVLAGLFAEGLEKSGIKDIMPTIRKVIEKVNKLSLEKQKKQFSKLDFNTSKRETREGLKELPNAEKGKVVMRMAPFPSGPLHIGNARTAILNDEYVKMYGGKLLLVMDDTIGSEVKQIEPEAYKLIGDGIKWLGVNIDKKIVYKSDRIEKYYTYAEKMLSKGYLYVCECDREKMRELKTKGVECSCRQHHPDKQMKKWREMFVAKEGAMTVRLKTNMQDSDPAFRDRVMFKISDRPHPRTKNKFRVYPSMEFSWAIDDHLLGITHVLRGMEHYMSTRVQDFIREIFGWKNPESIYNGHFAVEGVKISKSKSAQEVKSGIYLGWNDPRTWSLQSLRDRGIKPEAIREFIINLGMRKTNITAPIEALYAINRKMLENIPRYFFVENPEKITINGCPELDVKIPIHPNGKLRERNYKITQDFLISKSDFDVMQNGTYRLIHLLNFKFDDTEKTKSQIFSFISENPSGEKDVKFLRWLPAYQNNVDIEIIMPNGVLIKGQGEPALRKLKIRDIVYFEKSGFVKLHKKFKEKLEFWFGHT